MLYPSLKFKVSVSTIAIMAWTYNYIWWYVSDVISYPWLAYAVPVLLILLIASATLLHHWVKLISGDQEFQTMNIELFIKSFND